MKKHRIIFFVGNLGFQVFRVISARTLVSVIKVNLPYSVLLMSAFLSQKQVSVVIIDKHKTIANVTKIDGTLNIIFIV